MASFGACGSYGLPAAPSCRPAAAAAHRAALRYYGGKNVSNVVTGIDINGKASDLHIQQLSDISGIDVTLPI